MTDIRKGICFFFLSLLLSFSVSAQVTIVGWDGSAMSYQDFRFLSDDFIARYPYANTGIIGNVGVSVMNTFGGVSPSTASDATGDGNQVIFNENPLGHQPANQIGEGWMNGNGTKGWVFSFKTTGFRSLLFSGKMAATTVITGSSIPYQGPRDFKLQYSLNNSTWTDVAGATIVASDVGNGSSITFTTLNPVSLPVACENQATLFLQMIMTSNIAPDGTTISSQYGTSYIDDFKVTGIPIGLPVTFGSIQAYMKDGVLSVSWNTLLEKDCKEYAIEGSVDGAKWISLGKLNSKAINGNSDVKLNYEFSISAGSMAIAGISIAFMLLLMPVVRNRRMRFALAIAVLMLWVAACNKKDASQSNGKQINYIRIVQYSTDGTTGYSPVVKVVNQ